MMPKRMHIGRSRTANGARAAGMLFLLGVKGIKMLVPLAVLGNARDTGLEVKGGSFNAGRAFLGGPYTHSAVTEPDSICSKAESCGYLI